MKIRETYSEPAYINPKEVRVPRHHRALKPWALERLLQSMREHGYNVAYPIVIDKTGTLVDGGHRLEAALRLGISHIPFTLKPEGVSTIRFGLQCNADGQLCQPDDVFDLAELCHGLAEEEWSGQQLADELGWTPAFVTYHTNIREQLHPRAWDLARNGLTITPPVVKEEEDSPVKQELTIVNWRESHFRALLRHLPCVDGDHGAMRAQMAVLQDALKRWPTGKVTARWIEEAAARQAWHLSLKRYAIEHLAREVKLDDRKVLFKNINGDVFGREESMKSQEKFERTVSLLNEKALGVTLYWDDAMERIPLLKDGSVALVIADPPYNVSSASWDQFPSPEKYLEWMERWLEALRPKLACDYHLFLFCAPSYMVRVGGLLAQQRWPLKSHVVWTYRNLSMGRDVADKFISSWQPVFHCGTHPLNWSPEWSDERLDVQVHASPQSNFQDKKLHPMAKPLKLVELFVRVGSKPGDIVLDPFAGGGVTGEACSNVKQRRCVLIEKEEEFVATIERRLDIRRAKENGDE
ncbi:MAG: DNA methyltransferase [Chloroflexota bacterium]|nr:DNA methyltransferase [Chloroflexota bacterium]